jgi:hypothetical protein
MEMLTMLYKVLEAWSNKKIVLKNSMEACTLRGYGNPVSRRENLP